MAQGGRWGAGLDKEPPLSNWNSSRAIGVPLCYLR